MKKFIVVFSVLLSFVFILSCGGDKKDDNVIQLGVSLIAVVDPFDRILLEGIEAEAEKLGTDVKLTILDAKGDVNTQMSNMEQLINLGMDGILIWPGEAEPLSRSVEIANENGIPVVSVNTFTSRGEFTYVGSDDVEAGRIQGEWLAENLPENATYVYIMGPIGHTGQIGRKKGLEEVLSKKRPDVIKLAEQSSLWHRDKALSLTEDWLKTYPDVTAIVAQNDNSALGALEALRTANKIGDIIVAGTDATEEATEKIKNGELSMSVYQNAFEQGTKSLEVLYSIVNGTGSTDDIEIPFEAVDKNNVDQFIELYNSL